MWQGFKDSVGATWAVILAAVLALAVVGIIGIGYVTWIEPTYINQHAENIRHSVNYVDGHNAMMRSRISEYESAKAQFEHDAGNITLQAQDKAHMNSLYNEIKALANELSRDEVAADVQVFLSTNQILQ